jgi:hypothetical protein
MSNDSVDAAIHQYETLKQAADADAKTLQEAESAYYRFTDALDVLNRLTLALMNRGTLDAGAIHPELVEAVAAVISTAKVAGAWSDQLPDAPGEDPCWTVARHVFELVAAEDKAGALALLRRLPEAVYQLRDVGNALYKRVDPLVQARENTAALMELMAAAAEAGEREKETGAGQPTPVEGAGENAGSTPAAGMTRQEAAKRLERLRSQGEPWTSFAKMAEQLGCSSGTVHKAVCNTPSLQDWARQPEGAPRTVGQARCRTTRTEGADKAMTDNARSRELSPENEVAIREYIEQADPSDRAMFQAMPTEKQLELLCLKAEQEADNRRNKIFPRP